MAILVDPMNMFSRVRVCQDRTVTMNCNKVYFYSTKRLQFEWDQSFYRNESYTHNCAIIPQKMCAEKRIIKLQITDIFIDVAISYHI